MRRCLNSLSASDVFAYVLMYANIVIWSLVFNNALEFFR